jgi:hypothetical protein
VKGRQDGTDEEDEEEENELQDREDGFFHGRLS